MVITNLKQNRFVREALLTVPQEPNCAYLSFARESDRPVKTSSLCFRYDPKKDFFIPEMLEDRVQPNRYVNLEVAIDSSKGYAAFQRGFLDMILYRDYSIDSGIVCTEQDCPLIKDAKHRQGIIFYDGNADLLNPSEKLRAWWGRLASKYCE